MNITHTNVINITTIPSKISIITACVNENANTIIGKANILNISFNHRYLTLSITLGIGTKYLSITITLTITTNNTTNTTNVNKCVRVNDESTL